jgi:hypothetical protein
MIDNYINKHSIMGMMSSNYFPFEDWTGFYKKKDKTKVVVFDSSFCKDFLEINYYYLPEKIKELKSYSSTLLVSDFDEVFFKLSGKKYTEIRETRNKLNKEIEIREDISSIDEVISLIDRWDVLSGKKYRFNRHSGYDRNFFKKYYNEEKDNLYSLFFYLDNILVGYSIVSKIQDDGCFRYLIRKNDISVVRNLCLYIDYKTFENLFSKIGKKFYINWGASSGQVLRYKKKFPVFIEKKVWFCKRKKDDK